MLPLARRSRSCAQLGLSALRARLDDDKYPIAAQPGTCTLITDDAERGLVADNSIECGAFRVPGELLLANGRSRQPTRSLPDQPSSRAYAASNRQLADPGPAVRPARFASPSMHPPEGAVVPGCGPWCGRSVAVVPGCGPRPRGSRLPGLLSGDCALCCFHQIRASDPPVLSA